MLSEVKKRVNQEIATASKDMRKSECVVMKMESQILQLEKQEQQFGTWKARQMEYLDTRINKLRSSQSALEDALQEQALTMGEARDRLEHARMAAQMLQKGIDIPAVAKPVSGLEVLAAELAAKSAGEDIQEASEMLEGERMTRLVEKLLLENMLVHKENKGLQERLEREAPTWKHWSLEVEVEDLGESTDAGPDSSDSPSSQSDLSPEPCSCQPLPTSSQSSQASSSARVNPPEGWSSDTALDCAAAGGLDAGEATVKMGAKREDRALVRAASEAEARPHGTAMISARASPLLSKRRSSSSSGTTYPAGTVIYPGKVTPHHQGLTRCASQTPRLGARDAAALVVEATPLAKPLSVRTSPLVLRAPIALQSRAAASSSMPQAIPVHLQSQPLHGQSPVPTARQVVTLHPSVILPQASVSNVRLLPPAAVARPSSAADALQGDRHQATVLRAAMQLKPDATPRAVLRAEEAEQSSLWSQLLEDDAPECQMAPHPAAKAMHFAAASSSLEVSSLSAADADAASDALSSTAPAVDNGEIKGVADSSKPTPKKEKRCSSLSSVVHKLTARALQEYREAHSDDA